MGGGVKEFGDARWIQIREGIKYLRLVERLRKCGTGEGVKGLLWFTCSPRSASSGLSSGNESCIRMPKSLVTNIVVTYRMDGIVAPGKGGHCRSSGKAPGNASKL